jgi:peptidoglycan/LPS O-acetylase OafA/YrhL
VPYAGAVLVALMVARPLLFSHLPLTPWFQHTWQEPLTPELIARQFFSISTSPTINTAFWSLRYEMEMSLVFPAVCWAIQRMPTWLALLLTMALEKAGFLLLAHSRVGLWQAWSDTLIFASCFVYGALLARERDALGRLYARTPRWIKMAVLVLALAGYYGERESVLPFAASAAIVFARYSRAAQWLDTPLPEYLGRISYSMYLLHATMLWATLILLYGKVPLLALVLIYAGATFAVSHVFCLGVEEPAMRLGKRLTNRAA